MDKEITLRKKIPEYAIEPNAINQGMFNLSSYAQKLVAMAMTLISLDNDKYSVTFRTADFLQKMELEVRKQGASTKERIKAAVKECLNSHISIQKSNGDWEGYTWFSVCKLHKIDDTFGWEYITMIFNRELGDVVKELKRGFAKIDVAKLFKLQSKYAIRFYRLAFSKAGFAGKNGNPPGQWYFEMSLAEIRMLFEVDEKTYKATKDFRVFVIDEPLEELNAADIGLQMEPVYIRQGRYLVGVRFNCRWQKQKTALPGTGPDQAAVSLQDDSVLIAAFPEEFEKYKAQFLEEKNRQPGIHTKFPEMLEQAAEGEAINKLKEKHPDFCPGKNPKKNASRKKSAAKSAKAT